MYKFTNKFHFIFNTQYGISSVLMGSLKSGYDASHHIWKCIAPTVTEMTKSSN